MKGLDRMHDRIILTLIGSEQAVRIFIGLCQLYKYVGVFV